jgi:hypothetical protein
MAAEARRDDPRRFEVAVWSAQTLCGLAVGAPRSNFCRVDYVEGSPDPSHPLRGHVTIVALGVAVAYAAALGLKEVRLMNPLEDVVPHYIMLGFSLVSLPDGTTYCRVEVP